MKTEQCGSVEEAVSKAKAWGSKEFARVYGESRAWKENKGEKAWFIEGTPPKFAVVVSKNVVIARGMACCAGLEKRFEVC